MRFGTSAYGQLRGAEPPLEAPAALPRVQWPGGLAPRQGTWRQIFELAYSQLETRTRLRAQNAPRTPRHHLVEMVTAGRKISKIKYGRPVWRTQQDQNLQPHRYQRQDKGRVR